MTRQATIRQYRDPESSLADGEVFFDYLPDEEVYVATARINPSAVEEGFDGDMVDVSSRSWTVVRSTLRRFGVNAPPLSEVDSSLR